MATPKRARDCERTGSSVSPVAFKLTNLNLPLRFRRSSRLLVSVLAVARLGVLPSCMFALKLAPGTDDYHI